MAPRTVRLSTALSMTIMVIPFLFVSITRFSCHSTLILRYHEYSVNCSPFHEESWLNLGEYPVCFHVNLIGKLMAWMVYTFTTTTIVHRWMVTFGQRIVLLPFAILWHWIQLFYNTSSLALFPLVVEGMNQFGHCQWTLIIGVRPVAPKFDSVPNE